MTTFDSVTPMGETVPSDCSDDLPARPLAAPPRQGAVTHRLLPSTATTSVVGTVSPQSCYSPRLVALAYPIGCHGLIPLYFSQVKVVGQENLPRSGPVILAPTHRSRWDALLVPYAAGYHVTGRHLRFMVTSDEMRGVQGWIIRRLGGFSVDVKHPAIASLRQGVKLLQDQETLVIFPEGNIFRGGQLHSLKPGLARMALHATTANLPVNVQIVPIDLHYSHPLVPWRSQVTIRIGAPLHTADYSATAVKQSARQLTQDLTESLKGLRSPD